LENQEFLVDLEFLEMLVGLENLVKRDQLDHQGLKEDLGCQEPRDYQVFRENVVFLGFRVCLV